MIEQHFSSLLIAIPPEYKISTCALTLHFLNQPQNNIELPESKHNNFFFYFVYLIRHQTTNHDLQMLNIVQYLEGKTPYICKRGKPGLARRADKSYSDFEFVTFFTILHKIHHIYTDLL